MDNISQAHYVQALLTIFLSEAPQGVLAPHVMWALAPS